MNELKIGAIVVGAIGIISWVAYKFKPTNNQPDRDPQPSFSSDIDTVRFGGSRRKKNKSMRKRR